MAGVFRSSPGGKALFQVPGGVLADRARFDRPAGCRLSERPLTLSSRRPAGPQTNPRDGGGAPWSISNDPVSSQLCTDSRNDVQNVEGEIMGKFLKWVTPQTYNGHGGPAHGTMSGYLGGCRCM